MLRIYRDSWAKLGIVLFFFFVFTVDFRSSIFQNIVIAYIFAAVALFMLFYGSKYHFTSRAVIPQLLWLLSIFFVFTSMNASYVIKYIIGLLLMLTYSQNLGARKYTVKVLSVIGLIFAFFSFLFYFLPDMYTNNVIPLLDDYLQSTAATMIRSNRYPGLTGHYSTNGIYLALGLGATFSVLMVQANERKKSRTIYILAAVFIVGALLLIGKRAHLVFSIAGCFVVYWICNQRNKGSRFVKIIAIGIAALVGFVIAVNQIPALSNTFDRFVETSESGDFLMSRGSFYIVAWSEFLEHPIFGCGWKTMMDVIEHDVHNIYLQLLAETGIIGFILFTSLLIYGLVISWRCLSRTIAEYDSSKQGELALLCFASFYMSFFVMYGMTGNPLYDEQTFYILMISYGILIHYNNERKWSVQEAQY